MKLPEDRKERTKIYVLIGIGAAFVLYATVFGVLRPLMRNRGEKIAAIEELSAKLQASKTKIDQMNKSRGRNIETLSRIILLADEKGYVLKPRLGNYLLSARDFVEKHAGELNLEAEVREVGISQLPQASAGGEPRSLNVYTATVNAECGLHDLIRLLEGIEKGNPYLCVSGMSVAGQSKNPASHAVSFQLQWPVWADLSRLETIKENLRDLRSPRGRAAAKTGEET